MNQTKSKTSAVSVIIPTYNSASWLSDAVDSVLAQTARPTQILVIDDGSTDNTAAVVERYGDKIQYVRQVNQGVSAARNHGLKLANQPFVSFLDADDTWQPAKIEMQLNVMQAKPDLVLLGTRSFDLPGNPRSKVGCKTILSTVTWKQLVVKNRLVTSSVIARRDAISKAGLFDTSLQGPEDRDMWLRLARIGGVANLEMPLTGYRQVQGSVSKQAERCYTSMRRIIAKLDETGQLKGEWVLRRKALSHIENSVACIWSEGGCYTTALRMLIQSVAYYPFPFEPSEVEASLERPRRFAVYLLRMLGLKSCPVQQNSSAPRSEQTLTARKQEALYV